jgi:hypothetical protein
MYLHYACLNNTTLLESNLEGAGWRVIICDCEHSFPLSKLAPLFHLHTLSNSIVKAAKQVTIKKQKSTQYAPYSNNSLSRIMIPIPLTKREKENRNKRGREKQYMIKFLNLHFTLSPSPNLDSPISSSTSQTRPSPVRCPYLLFPSAATAYRKPST